MEIVSYIGSAWQTSANFRFAVVGAAAWAKIFLPSGKQYLSVARGYALKSETIAADNEFALWLEKSRSDRIVKDVKANPVRGLAYGHALDLMHKATAVALFYLAGRIAPNASVFQLLPARIGTAAQSAFSTLNEFRAAQLLSSFNIVDFTPLLFKLSEMALDVFRYRTENAQTSNVQTSENAAAWQAKAERLARLTEALWLTRLGAVALSSYGGATVLSAALMQLVLGSLVSKSIYIAPYSNEHHAVIGAVIACMGSIGSTLSAWLQEDVAAHSFEKLHELSEECLSIDTTEKSPKEASLLLQRIVDKINDAKKKKLIQHSDGYQLNCLIAEKLQTYLNSVVGSIDNDDLSLLQSDEGEKHLRELFFGFESLACKISPLHKYQLMNLTLAITLLRVDLEAIPDNDPHRLTKIKNLMTPLVLCEWKSKGAPSSDLIRYTEGFDPFVMKDDEHNPRHLSFSSLSPDIQYDYLIEFGYECEQFEALRTSLKKLFNNKDKYPSEVQTFILLLCDKFTDISVPYQLTIPTLPFLEEAYHQLSFYDKIWLKWKGWGSREIVSSG